MVLILCIFFRSYHYHFFFFNSRHLCVKQNWNIAHCNLSFFFFKILVVLRFFYRTLMDSTTLPICTSLCFKFKQKNIDILCFIVFFLSCKGGEEELVKIAHILIFSLMTIFNRKNKIKWNTSFNHFKHS